jgi:L-threonylcarbamoyladenylate synthase
LTVHVIPQNQVDPDELARILRRPAAVIGAPTDSTYGLVARASDTAAVKRVYQLKDRPRGKPLVCLLGSLVWIERYCLPVNEQWRRLALSCWPGPCNLVLPAGPAMPTAPLAGGNSVAVRIPDNPLLQRLLDRLDEPLVAPSANPDGAPASLNAAQVAGYFSGGLELIIDGGASWSALGSSIVDFSTSSPRLLREGGIGRACLEALLGGPLYSRVTPSAQLSGDSGETVS